jgi:arsenate reductase
MRGSADDIRRAFRDAFFLLERRINLFLNLPLAALDRLSLQRELDAIGRREAKVEQ